MDDRLLAALQRDIATRLRSVCDTMTEEQFEQLVRDIAAVKLKYGLESDVVASLRETLASQLAVADSTERVRTN